MPTAAITISALSFSQSRACIDIDRLEVAVGEIVAIVGPTGCGKTTFLKLLAGLLPPDPNARIMLFNKRITEVVAQGRINFSFQAPVLLPWLNVSENIALPLRLLGRDISGAERSTIKESLRLVRLDPDVADLFPDKLSSGMASRVAVAQALVSGCDLLIMDEVFGTLDEVTRTDLDETLREINDNRMKATILFVTHSIDEALLIGDRILVFRCADPEHLAGSILADLPVKLPTRRALVRYEPEFRAQKIDIESRFPRSCAFAT